jgi:hypothetical protein
MRMGCPDVVDEKRFRNAVHHVFIINCIALSEQPSDSRG